MFENESECFEAVGLDPPGEERVPDEAAPEQQPVRSAPEAPEETEAGADDPEPGEEGGQPSAESPGREAPAATGNDRDRSGFFRRLRDEMEEIRRYDASIRTASDLLTLDRFDEFRDEVVNHGHTFLEAYRYVYADRIAEEKAQKAARQAAQRTRNNDRGKEHMRRTGAVGTGDVTVPPEVEKNIRAVMPRATAAEIREYYRKYDRQTG